MKIYTKTGDGGETSLYGGERRSKADLRVEAYGVVDELQAALGVISAFAELSSDILVFVQAVQRDCFVLSAMLARTETKVERKDPLLKKDRVGWLEAQIDAWEATLPTLRAFILPGGSLIGSHAHLARAICRRAERAVIALNQAEAVDMLIPRYLNRLSDALFVMARAINHRSGIPEEEWHATD
jgi:cob(I)alamin adenosyltransferase